MLEMKSLTRRHLLKCAVYMSVKYVVVERRRGAAGSRSPGEAHERKQSTRRQLLAADPREQNDVRVEFICVTLILTSIIVYDSAGVKIRGAGLIDATAWIMLIVKTYICV